MFTKIKDIPFSEYCGGIAIFGIKIKIVKPREKDSSIWIQHNQVKKLFEDLELDRIETIKDFMSASFCVDNFLIKEFMDIIHKVGVCNNKFAAYQRDKYIVFGIKINIDNLNDDNINLKDLKCCQIFEKFCWGKSDVTSVMFIP